VATVPILNYGLAEKRDETFHEQSTQIIEGRNRWRERKEELLGGFGGL
jgi:hypothetical protein